MKWSRVSDMDDPVVPRCGFIQGSVADDSAGTGLPRGRGASARLLDNHLVPDPVDDPLVDPAQPGVEAEGFWTPARHRFQADRSTRWSPS